MTIKSGIPYERKPSLCVVFHVFIMLIFNCACVMAKEKKRKKQIIIKMEPDVEHCCIYLEKSSVTCVLAII